MESSSGHAYGVKLVVAYDGSDFCGFQLQDGHRTVQGELERAAALMTGHPVRVRAASRTDSGVHALGQVAAFSCSRLIKPRGWMQGLNTHLPDDVRIQAASECSPEYDPRFDSLGKLYRYVIQQGEAKNPLIRNHAWQIGHVKIDPAAMRNAAALLIGTHDYRAFRSADDQRPNTMRTLWSITVRDGFADDRNLVAIDVHGSAFMKNMVRILVGTLFEVGIGRFPIDRMPGLLGPSARREDAGRTAPAHGLTLVEVALGRQALLAQQAEATAPDTAS